MKLAYAALAAFALAAAPAVAQESDAETPEGPDAAAQESGADAPEGSDASAQESDASAQESDADAPEGPDEVETALEAALEAYREGDFEMATEEVQYAQQLMLQLKTERLAGFLPEPLDGWERQDGETGGMPGLGGMMASATYVGPDGNRVEVQLMSDNQMVASMMMMFNNAAMIGQMGELMRVGRQKVIRTKEDELQAMLDNNVLISISGDAPVDAKTAYLERIDLQALEGF